MSVKQLSIYVLDTILHQNLYHNKNPDHILPFLLNTEVDFI
jgi:hypothetical protein